MANSENANTGIEKARDAGNLESAIVIGKDDQGKVAIFTAQVDKEKMIVMLERARSMLVQSLE